MIENYFYIDYVPHEDWVLSIMGAVQHSDSPILQQRWEAAAQSALAELPLALVTKFEVMKVTLKRLNDHLYELGQDFDARPDEVQRHIIGVDGQPSAYHPQKPALPFEIVADIEAFIFGLRSTYESMIQTIRNGCCKKSMK